MLANSRGMGLILAGLLTMPAVVPVTAIAQSEVAQEKFQARAENRPLRSLQEAADRARARPVAPRPAIEIPNFRGQGKPASDGLAAPDALLQASAGQQAVAIGSGFPGASNEDNAALLGFRIAPPDTDGQVGRDHFVQMINLLTTVYNKDGSFAGGGPFPSNAIWDGVGGNCEPFNQGDPIVLYDDTAGRWLVSQFAFPDNLKNFSQCVAISQGENPTLGWNRYEFSFNNFGLNDYPKHGIVSDSITMMANLFRKRGRNFTWNGTFLGVMDKAAMYAGAPTATLIGFNIGTAEFGFVAGDLDGASTVPVPALFGTAMSTNNRFDIWKVDVDWGTSNASASRIAQVPITPFDSNLCSASRGACIPQPNNGPRLESLSDRLMHRLQIRDFGTHRSMVTAHTVDVDGNGRAGIRWYELREAGGSWSLHQEGTFGPDDGQHRWMPSAAMNQAGDIGIGYLLSGTGTFVSTAVAGQSSVASGSGLLDSAELVCAAGSGVQTGVSRSGDYSSTSVDPIDDTFWHTNEVFNTTGDFRWDTFVCEFAVGSGGNISPIASFSLACTNLACNFTDGSSDPDGSIAGWAWDFGDGDTSGAQSPSHTFAAAGSYTVSLTVTDNEGATGNTFTNVTVTDGTSNSPPTASFTPGCTDLDCTFTDGSTDSDGTVDLWDWDFGDGTTSSAQSPLHSYGAAGSFTVVLTVTDNGGATDSDTQIVEVTSGGGSSLSGSSENNGRTWTARVSSSSGDLNGTWSFTGGVAGCLGNECSLSGIPKKEGSVVFTAIPSGEQLTIPKP